MRVEAALQAARPASQVKPVLPHLDKFDGNKQYLDAWVFAAKNKLAVDGAAIGGYTAQVAYLYQSLSPAVQAQQLAFVSSTAMVTAEALFDRLGLAYGDVKRAERAQVELVSARQSGREGLAHYLVRFNDILHRAEAHNWPDAAKKTALLTSLAPQWQRRLAERSELPATYDALVATLRQLDGNTFLLSVPRLW
jgi:hypothetical protein